jgi:hypothetical protein
MLPRDQISGSGISVNFMAALPNFGRCVIRTHVHFAKSRVSDCWIRQTRTALSIVRGLAPNTNAPGVKLIATVIIPPSLPPGRGWQRKPLTCERWPTRVALSERACFLQPIPLLAVSLLKIHPHCSGSRGD